MSQRKRVLYRGVSMIKGWPEKIEAAQRLPSFTLHGRSIPRIPYGREQNDWGADKNPCHDCRVLKGEFHVPSCDVEECPVCGAQVLSCDCKLDLVLGNEQKPRLISSRSGAAIAVILTGLVGAQTFRAAFWQAPHRFHWIMPLDYLRLPLWALWTVNLGFYVWLLFLCTAFPRSLRGKERILVAGWVPGVLLSPVQGIVPASLANGIQYVKAASIMGAFFAAVAILLEGPTRDDAPSNDDAVPE